MTIAVETYLIVALAFAVFSAITALGTSLVLGIGFERLRAGFELIKGQTAYFSDSIHALDKRTDSLEKQGSYFFKSLHSLEEQAKIGYEQAAHAHDGGALQNECTNLSFKRKS